MTRELVVKSNKLIEAAYELSVAEQKVLLSAITQIRHTGSVTDEVMYTISANALSDMGGFSAKNEYRSLKAAARRLFNRIVVVKDGNDIEETRWVQTCKYKPDQGSVELRFSKDILPYLNQLTGHFTQYKLKNIAGMTSNYGIRLYELLVQWRGAGERELSLDAFREMLSIKSEQYSRIQNLKAKVITPAVKDINTHSDLWVKWGQRKTGRRVTHLQFQFGEKNKPPSTKTKMGAITRTQIEQNARPGETYQQAENRLKNARKTAGKPKNLADLMNNTLSNIGDTP